MTIRIVAQGRVSAENVPVFQKFVDEVSAMVRDKEAGRTLTYEYYATGPDRMNFLIHEEYADADAYVEHMTNLGTNVKHATDTATFDLVIVSGKLPEQRVTELRGMAGPGMIYYGETFD